MARLLQGVPHGTRDLLVFRQDFASGFPYERYKWLDCRKRSRTSRGTYWSFGKISPVASPMNDTNGSIVASGPARHAGLTGLSARFRLWLPLWMIQMARLLQGVPHGTRDLLVFRQDFASGFPYERYKWLDCRKRSRTARGTYWSFGKISPVAS